MQTSKPLHIFKPGRHTAMSGAVLDFSESALAACAAAYDPALSEAPIVVGHPRLDGPAFGWIRSLAIADGLQATPHQVNPEFAALVNAGAYKKISAAFYAPDAPNNPVPGVYYLRHVGFLGAAAPAVKGLAGPAFAADEEGVVEFSEQDDVDNASLWRSLRDWLIGKFGLDEADKVTPTYLISSLEQGAQDEVREAVNENPAESAAETVLPTPSFAEESLVTPEEKAALEAENAALKTRLAEIDASNALAKSAALHADHTQFCEALVISGQMTPGVAPLMIAALDQLAAGTPVEFGEGEAAQPLPEALKAALKGAPRLIEFSETSRDTDATAAVEFAAPGLRLPQGYDVDARGLDLHRKAQAHAAAQSVDYLTAVRAVGAP